MVYAGTIGKQNVSLGVSGRLDGREMRNLIMWDSETNSLWSQLKGESVYGKSKGKKLGMLPAIFVGLGTWKQMHPKTLVLNMSTVRVRSWFYKTTDLARGSVRGRRGSLRLGIGVRAGSAALAVTAGKIRQSGVVNAAVGGVPLAFVWVAAHDVPLVYDRRVDGETRKFELKRGKLITGELSFDPLSGSRMSGKGAALVRFPYIPTYMKAWAGYYPKGATIE